MNAQQAAQQNIIATLGLDPDQTTWTYDQRLAYNNALATWIAANPDSATGSVAGANAVLNENNTPLADTGFLSEFSEFTGDLEDEAVSAGQKIAGIGNGILNTASLASWLIPTIAILAVVILLYGFFKKQTA